MFETGPTGTGGALARMLTRPAIVSPSRQPKKRRRNRSGIGVPTRDMRRGVSRRVGY